MSAMKKDSNGKKEILPLSEELKRRIAFGEEQIRNGQVKTNEEVFARFDRWLSSK